MNNKLLLSTIACSTLLLSACAGMPMTMPTTSPTPNTTAQTINTGVSIGKVAFQMAVNTKCNTQIEKSKIWKTAKLVMTPSKQQQVKYNVCGCVSQKALENVTIDQLTIAAVDANARKALMVNSVTNSLTSCYGQVMKTLGK
ncbi:MAG: hypothetical protein KGV51_06590 [Moraxellaceae bacterium]|nr:hypothetical protein [Moraxellaceae bacterium]